MVGEDESKRKPLKVKEIERTWLDMGQLCDYLGISQSQSYNLRRRGLPYCKIGKSVRFDKRKVDKFITKYEVRERPAEEVLAELGLGVVTEDRTRGRDAR
jgi:excisionase family DNA binding protein